MSLDAKMKRQAAAAYTLNRYLEEPEEERKKRIQEVCSRCRFAYGTWHQRRSLFKMLWCNWDSFHEGRIRPCAGRDCVATGIFQPAGRNGRETVAKLLSRENYSKMMMSEKRGKRKSHEDA